MLKRFSLLLLVAAIGCTQSGGAPDSVPESTVGTPAEPAEVAEASLDLPDDTATMIEFYCPGMT